MRKLLIVPVILVLALTGCQDSSNPFYSPDHGSVKNKDYTAAYSSVVETCSSYDKNGYCSYYYPQTQYHSAVYQLDIWLDKDHHGWQDVDPYTYHHCKIGEYFEKKACNG